MAKNINRVLLALMMIVVFLVTNGCSAGDENAVKENPKTQVKREANAQKAYNFTLEDLEGATHKLSDFIGKVVIVDIWDTWCPPCRKEIPHFIELHNEYADKGFVMIGIAGARYGADAVRQFVEEYNIPYLNLLPKQEVFDGFGGIMSIPTTFVIDKEGYIYKKYIGYKPKTLFEKDIKLLISAQ